MSSIVKASAMTKGTILVTGGTGFLGSHVISQLLEKGYIVRGTARASSKLHAAFPKADPKQLQIVEVPSLTFDHSAHLKGVDAVVHVASPFAGEKEELFKGAYEGTVNIVRQAIAAGVKKIIVTGGFVSLFGADWKDAFGTRMLTEKDFGPVTLDTLDIAKLEERQVFQAAKTLAEKKVWEIAHENPDVDITTIVPPVLFGPLITPLTSSPSSLGTNVLMRILLSGGSGSGTYPPVPIGHMIDVRDAARAHVLALSVPPIPDPPTSSPRRDKRFLVLLSTFTWKEVADLVRREWPELGDRLPKEDAVKGPQSNAPFDTSFARETLEVNPDGYVRKEETFLAAVDAAVEWERLFGSGASGSGSGKM